MKPHKHAALIKAWADGAEIQYFNTIVQEWRPAPHPYWDEDVQYRIKPEPKPDVKLYYYMDISFCTPASYSKIPEHNLELVFDGETGKLKDAKVL